MPEFCCDVKGEAGKGVTINFTLPAELVVVRAAANGQKDAAITRAQGEAEANRLINESLTTNLLALRISETQKIQWGLE